MNKLALSALMLGGLLQAAGCIITTDDDGEGGTLDVSWSIACPAGASVEVISQNASTGERFADPFDCAGSGGMTDLLALGTYNVWVEVLNGTTLLAQSNSISATLTVDGDIALVAIPQFPIDTGTFGVTWSLVDSSKGVLTCADVGSGGVDILATLAGTTEAISDVFTCTDGKGETGPMAIGPYKYVVEVLNTATPPLALDVSVEKEASIVYGNEFVDLGNFEFEF